MKSVSGRKLCKVLEKKGWKPVRVQGSHYHYTKQSNPFILTVPVHKNKDLKIGLLRKLMKMSGIKEKHL